MTTTYTQTDTSATFNVGCSGRSAGLTTAARTAEVGGTAGSSEVTVDPNNNGTTLACFAFDVPVADAPGLSSWDSGTWNVTINFTTGDAGTTLEEVHICDNNGGTYSSVAGGTSETAIGYATTSGSTTRNISQGSNHTPQSEANSRPFVVIVLSNTDDHGAASVGITPSATIVAPYTVGGGADSGWIKEAAIKRQTHRRLRM